jgi:phosphoglycolate phosphatase-like HAD superfamily hydrolase
VITTLLIDLDDTLLGNDVNRFIPAYLNLLGQYLEPIVPPEKLIEQLNVGTQAMIANTSFEKTLAEVFEENFFPGLGMPKDVLITRFDTFYAEEFKKLKYLTTPIAGAHRLMTFAIKNQLDIVIATNPLFPLTAIQQRLDWAGLPSSQFPYTVITSYETFHYAKPKLEYVTEILAKCGRHPHEAAMIGNDPLLDLPPAAELGVATFLISDNSSELYPSGDLDAAIRWLQESPPDSDPTQCASPHALLARMRGNLVAFTEIANLVQEDQWYRKPSPDAWAPIEVICHLRDVEKEINYRRITRILNEAEPFLSAHDSDRWAEERGYIDESPAEAIQALIQARVQSISTLEIQPVKGWSRPTRHAIFGPTQLSEIVRIFLEHDILHLRQIYETITTLRAVD